MSFIWPTDHEHDSRTEVVLSTKINRVSRDSFMLMTSQSNFLFLAPWHVWHMLTKFSFLSRLDDQNINRYSCELCYNGVGYFVPILVCEIRIGKKAEDPSFDPRPLGFFLMVYFCLFCLSYGGGYITNSPKQQVLPKRVDGR